MYISKGTVISPSTEDLLFVVRGGVKFQLTGQEAALSHRIKEVFKCLITAN